MAPLAPQDVRAFSELLAKGPMAAGQVPSLELVIAALMDRYYIDTGCSRKYPNDWKWFIETAASLLSELVKRMDARYEGLNAMGSRHFADRFDFKGQDACCHFFQACLRAARYDIPPGSKVLEIGCAEFDWIAEMRRCCPDIDVTGIDWRKHAGAIQGDVLTYDFEPASFDAIVSISAVEHVGLGHYEQDPVEPDGDSKAIARALNWLKPGGILFFDVPFNPDGYRVVGTSHREYDRDAMLDRLWIKPLVETKNKARWLWEGYAKVGREDQVQTERPTEKADPFWYAGVVYRKVGAT